MAADAYLETVAQICAVLALTAVLEARFALRSWRPETPQVLRVVQAIFYSVGILAVTASIVIALYLLASGADDSGLYVLLSWGLGIGLGVTVLGPVVRILIAAFAIQLVKATRSSEAKQEDEALRVVDRIAHEHLADNLKTVDLMIEMKDDARDALRKARRNGADADEIKVLKKHLRGRTRDVERYTRNLSRAIKLAEEAEELGAKAKAARDRTDEAQAAAIVAEEQGVTPEA